jgi:hypothetical protein
LKSFKVFALSQKGRDAVLKNFEERKRMKLLEKVLFNKLFDVIIMPLGESIEFRGKTLASGYVDSDSMVQTMSESMKSCDCLEGEDFRVEVSQFE